MPQRLCTSCRQLPGIHRYGRGSYCDICDPSNEDHSYVELPEGHPFTIAREERIARMCKLADLGLPLFEDEHKPDLR